MILTLIFVKQNRIGFGREIAFEQKECRNLEWIKLRRERGTDRTAASIGCIRYKDLRKKDHEAAIVVELGAREIVRTTKDGWKIKLDVLKGNERDQHSFEPKSSIEAFLQINS